MLIFDLIRFLHVFNKHGLVYDLLSQKWYRFFFKKNNSPIGNRICLALQEVGPTFVKIGQMLATRPDIVSKDIATALTELQDKIPPFNSQQAINIIESELSSKINDLFDDFQVHPIASASIAQVHKARLKTGECVAVKVLRPNIEAQFTCDIKLFLKIASLVEKYVPRLHRFKPREVVDFLQDCLSMETDLRLEAAAASKFRQNFKDNDDLYVPQVYWDYTTKRVLTLSWIDGVRIDDLVALHKQNINPQELLKRASVIFFTQVFEHGYFHGDLHPGNVFVMESGRIAVMDFGIMGYITPSRRNYLADLFHSFIIGDYDRVADLHFDTGIVDVTKSRTLFAAMARAIGEPMLQRPMRDVSLAKLLGQVFTLTEHFQLQNQVDLLLVHKNMMLSEGIGKILNPEVNMWQLARPHIIEWMKKQNSPRKKIIDLIQNVELLMQQLQQKINRDFNGDRQ